MKKYYKKIKDFFKKGQISTKGFTLIEMLVVVAVVGILASVILTTLEPARNKAKDTRIIQEVNQIRSLAESMYDGDYSELPELPKLNIQNKDLRLLVEDIKNQGGDLHIHKSGDQTRYAAYTRLNSEVGAEPNLKVQYYCVDSGGNSITSTEKPEYPRRYMCPVPNNGE